MRADLEGCRYAAVCCLLFAVCCLLFAHSVLNNFISIYWMSNIYYIFLLMASCAILNVTEAKKDKEDKKGCCAIIDVTELKGALNYGKRIKKRLFG